MAKLMTVVRSNSSAKVKPNPKLRPRADLEVVAGTFSKGTLTAIVDECIVPVLLEIFLRTRMALPVSSTDEHNVDNL
jgi:hypothetical protein